MSLTTYKGQQKAPALSPDGSRVAFSWDGPDEGRFSIYVKPLDSPNPVRLTHDNTTDDNYPAWSPDGRWIAFYRNTGDDGAVYIIPSEGGRETRLARGRGDSLVWMRDGSGVIVSDRESGSMPLAAYLVPLERGERRQITHPPDDAMQDHCFSISRYRPTENLSCLRGWPAIPLQTFTRRRSPGTRNGVSLTSTP